MSMKTVTARIQGRDYSLACDVGQENHLYHLVQQFNGRAEVLTKSVGKLSEPMLLLYTALMFADELHEAQREIAGLQQQLAHMQTMQNERGDDARIAALEEGMAESLHALASRIEGIAEKLSA